MLIVGGTALTLSGKVLVPVPNLLLAVILRSKLPSFVGIPESVPDSLSEIPAGRESALQVIGVAPVAVSVVL